MCTHRACTVIRGELRCSQPPVQCSWSLSGYFFHHVVGHGNELHRQDQWSRLANPTGSFGHKARFAFRVFKKKYGDVFVYTPKFSVTGTWLRFQILAAHQHHHTKLQTDSRQRTSGPVPIRLLIRSPEVPDTLSLARPADHRGHRAKASF